MKIRSCLFVLSIMLPGAGAIAQQGSPEVLATFGDSIAVSNADLAAAVRGLPEKSRDAARTEAKAATALLDTILLNRVLAKQAREQGLADTPEVKAEVQQAVERVLSVRRMEAFEATLAVPDYTAAAKEQYELNKAKFVDPEQIHAAHVLVARHAKDPEVARKTAEEVRAKAAAGADFAMLAGEFSDDRGSRSRGGDLGFFVRGRMVKEFEQAAFAMKEPGEISPVVESPFGFHVLKFLERKPARQKTFEEVKDQIIAPMRAKFVNAEKARLTSAIRNDPGIKLNTEAIDRLIGVGADGKPLAAPAAAPAKK